MTSRSVNTCAIAILVAAVMSLTVGYAADHIDGPRATADPAADITDIYAFMSQDPATSGRLVLIMNVVPVAPVTAEFSDAVDYIFRVNQITNPATLALGPALDVTCKYSRPTMTCNGPKGLKASTKVGAMTGKSPDAMRAFAGPRSDPFFFDFAAFKATAATGKPAFTSTGTNFFQGLNVLSIVVEIDVERAFGKGAIVTVAGETRRKGRGAGPIDRMGRAAVSTALNLNDDVMKDAYNQEPSVQDWAKNTRFDANFEKNLETFDKLDGNVEWMITNGIHPLREALKLDVLIVDTGKKCESQNRFCEGGYLEIEAELLLGGPTHTTSGGRTPNEDVIDKTLTLLVTKGTSPVSDGVAAATQPSTHTFPYLAAPNKSGPRVADSNATGAALGPGGMQKVPTTSAAIFRENFEGQIAELDFLHRADPGSVWKLQMLSDLHASHGKYAGDLDEIQLGIDQISQCIEAEPNNSELLLDRANQQQTLHRFSHARADLARARQLGASEIRVGLVAQELDWNEGLYAEAIAAIKKTASRQRTSATVAREAQLYHDLGLRDESDRAFARAEDAVRDTSPLPVAWLDVQRGLHMTNTGRFDEAVAFFTAAVDRLPSYLMAKEHLAEALHLVGRDAEAISIYEGIVKHSTDPEFMGALAKLYAAHGRLPEARELTSRASAGFDQRLRTYPEAMYWHAAQFFLDQGNDPRKALALLRQNVAIRPNSESYTALARAELANGLNEDARVSIERALAMPVRSGDLFWTAARVYRRLGAETKSGQFAALARDVNAAIERLEPAMDVAELHDVAIAGAAHIPVPGPSASALLLTPFSTR